MILLLLRIGLPKRGKVIKLRFQAGAWRGIPRILCRGGLNWGIGKPDALPSSFHRVVGLSAGPEQVRVHDESENTSSLVTWTDRNIQSGDSWEDEVDRALKRCAVGILLIDQAWVNSTFIQRKEFPAILKKLQGQKDFLLLPVKMTSYYIKPEIETMLSKTQFVGGTETVAIDALGNTEYEVKNRRKDVWVEIARRVAEFKKSRAAAPPA